MRKLGRRSAVPLLVLASLLYGLWLVVQLPMLGYADNGDGWRVQHAAGLLDFPTAHLARWKYVERHYRLASPNPGAFVSSASFVAWIASVPSRLLSWQYFDLRYLGLLYWLLFASSILWLWWRGLPGPVVLLFSLAAFDSATVLAGNSFQSEVIFYVALMVAFGFLLLSPAVTRRVRAADNFWFLFWVALGTLAKVQFLLFPLLLAPFVWKRDRRLVAGLAAIFLLAWTAFLSPWRLNLARSLEWANAFNRVFYGVAVLSPDPVQALKDLEISAPHRANAGRNFLHPVTAGPGLNRELESFGTVSRVARYYVLHPSLVLSALGQVTRVLPGSSRTYTGTFEDRGRAPGLQYVAWGGLSVYADGLLRALPGAAVWLLLWGIWLLPLLDLGSPSAPALRFLALFCLTQVPIAILGDGVMGLSRHVMAARFGWNLLLAWYVLRGLTLLGSLRTIRRAGEIMMKIPWFWRHFSLTNRP